MNFYEKTAEIIEKEKILQNEPMSKHTTFRTGGNADVFVKPETADDIKNVVAKCKAENIPYHIIGNGSNILVGDKGIRGVVIHLGSNFSDIEINGTAIKAQSGALLSAVAYKALENSLKGFEFAGGIPGTVGGGAVMNAGAYGGEFKDIVKKVTVLKDDEIISLSNKDCGFEYRTSRIMKENMIVLDVEFELRKGTITMIKMLMNDLNKRRRDKQPLNYPSAGSTFKRPEGYFAGQLIEASGLKGFSIGGAEVSELHAGFVINKADATSEDIKSLIEHIQSEVMRKQGIKLEPEIRMIGEF